MSRASHAARLRERIGGPSPPLTGSPASGELSSTLSEADERCVEFAAQTDEQRVHS